MEDNFKKVFKNTYYKVEPELSNSIYQALLEKERRTRRVGLSVYASLSLASFVGFVLTVRSILQEFSQSGFYEYMSLVFSDAGSVAAHWKEFALTVTDSLPVMSVVFSLALILIVGVSLRRAADRLKKNTVLFA